jgi:hypothetical protein
VASASRSIPSMPVRWPRFGAVRSCYKEASAGAVGRGRGLLSSPASKLNGGCTRSLPDPSLPRPDSVKPSRRMPWSTGRSDWRRVRPVSAISFGPTSVLPMCAIGPPV